MHLTARTELLTANLDLLRRLLPLCASEGRKSEVHSIRQLIDGFEQALLEIRRNAVLPAEEANKSGLLNFAAGYIL